MELTGAHLEELEERGYIILPGFRHGEELKQMQEAQRRVLPSWEQVKGDPPSGHSAFADFPPPEIALLHGIVHHQAWDFAREWFDSEHIHFRAGSMIARYPSFKGGGTGSDAGALHLDNGNNSLLPPSDSARAFGQLVFWHHLEEVAEDQAPLRLIPKEHGRDMSKAEPLICEAGTLCVFTNYTMHSASDYLRADGQRYTWGFGLGRADHYWEGFRHYTDKGKNPIFCEFIGALTAAEREVFRFPPAGHAYYTPQTLTALEEQYPGWNARSEY